MYVGERGRRPRALLIGGKYGGVWGSVGGVWGGVWGGENMPIKLPIFFSLVELELQNSCKRSHLFSLRNFCASNSNFV